MRYCRRKILHGEGCEAGFTLAELLVVVMIMAVFMVGVGAMIESGSSGSMASYALTRIDEDANTVIDSLTRQVRVAQYINPSSSGSVLYFSGDLTGDGNMRPMIYMVSGGSLVRGSSPDALQSWVEGVESITFRYYRYNPDTRQMVEITPGSSGWNALVERVDFEIRFSRQAGKLRLGRTYDGSVTLRNRLRS
ncbi:MAG: prepilin-type N-terminal cleavage/methylation domain-containing protein [Actinobacteria bacterium]|nr:prepilin-type N-terminal cleavage/methylation domain-containing protein [Actinomycetota bacterium]